MAERKRPSTTTTSNESKKVKLSQTADRPMCKYGAKCYRKHPDHLKTYRHPTAETSENETFDDESTVSPLELTDLTGEDLLFKVYQMKFPRDLFQLWNFCSNLDKENPRNVLKNVFKLELVGPFEVLDGALKNCEKTPNMHLHYRYFYDAPEFLTAIRTVDASSQFHIGFYRDSPDELPAFVASNDSKTNQRFKILGENLFAAIFQYARTLPKSNEKTDFLQNFETFAKKNSFSLDETTTKINARKKKIVCTLFNSLGMVVPVENDIGYRPVPMSKEEFKRTCDKFCQSSSENQVQAADDDLQHVITCIQFANDECDYGEGLEFGLNLFLYGSAKLHSRILSLLPLAYQLLNRNLFGQILIDHLGSGRSKSTEDLNQIEKNK